MSLGENAPYYRRFLGQPPGKFGDVITLEAAIFGCRARRRALLEWRGRGLKHLKFARDSIREASFRNASGVAKMGKRTMKPGRRDEHKGRDVTRRRPKRERRLFGLQDREIVGRP